MSDSYTQMKNGRRSASIRMISENVYQVECKTDGVIIISDYIRSKDRANQIADDYINQRQYNQLLNE